MDQVTKKEVAEHIQELFDAIEDPRPIDVIKDPSIIRDLRAKRRECFEMVNYLMDHPLRAFKYTVAVDSALSFLEDEAIREIDKIERQYKLISNDPPEPENNFI